jgi:cytoskeletal protein CcmA (bactofilin family)
VATLNGSVDGDVRLLAQSVELYGAVNHNVSFIADQTTIRDTAQITGSVTGVATNLTVLGPVAESIEGRYTNLLLASDVGKDVDVSISNDFNSGLHVLATARINGDVRYQALQPAQVAKGAVISGDQNYNLQSAGNERLWLINFGDSNWWLSRLAYFAALLLTALILWRLGNKRWHEVAESMLLRSRKSLWYGLLWLVFAPVAALILIVTLIGLPLGLVMTALYLASWYFYPAWTCLYVTSVLAIRSKSVKALPIPWQIMLGLIIIIALQQLPFVGPFFSLILYLLTVGALTDSWLRWLASKKS